MKTRPASEDPATDAALERLYAAFTEDEIVMRSSWDEEHGHQVTFIMERGQSRVVARGAASSSMRESVRLAANEAYTHRPDV